MVGPSIIQRTGEHSKIRPTGTFLGLQQLGCQLVWVEMPGMRLGSVVPSIQSDKLQGHSVCSNYTLRR